MKAENGSIIVISRTESLELLQAADEDGPFANPDHVLHVRIAREASAESAEGERELLKHLAERRYGARLPVVALWESEHPGDLAHMCAALAHLGMRLQSEVQHDRAPLRLDAVVVVASRGMTDEDRRILESLASGRSADSLRILIPSKVPVYVMTERSRADPFGRSWKASESWPLAVSRLLASIVINPRRVTGLRAWRSFQLRLDSQDELKLRRIGLQLLQHAIDGADLGIDSVKPEPRREEREAKQLEPPDDKVDDVNTPRHAKDKKSGGAPYPPVSDFWALEESERKALERLGQGAQSLWSVRKSERGKEFQQHRSGRTREFASTIHGPRKVIRHVWSKLHESPRLIDWYAGVQFFKSPKKDQRAIFQAQSERWQQIVRLDGDAVRLTQSAQAQAIELDLARSYFPGIGWRLACIITAALWSASAVGVVSGGFSLRTTMMVGALSAVSAILAGVIVLWLEVRAGRRGTELLERTSQRAEAAIADSFRARIQLGAEGELTQRQTVWWQCADRVRQSVKRIFSLYNAAIESELRNTGERRRIESGPEYRDATTITANAEHEIDVVSTRCERRQEERATELNRQFQKWWNVELGQIDPSTVGGISSVRFRRSLTAELRNLRHTVHQDLLQLFEDVASTTWSERLRPEVAKRIGDASDLSTLSVRTTYSRGHRLDRSTFVMAHSPTIRRTLTDVTQESVMGAAKVQDIVTHDNTWVGLGLILDEISVHFKEVNGDWVVCEGRAAEVPESD